MAKDFPVGAAQEKVLNALGLAATGFSDANRIFDEIGIEVSSKRVGRSSEPVISRKQTSFGGWNPGGDGEEYTVSYKSIDLTPVSQWMK